MSLQDLTSRLAHLAPKGLIAVAVLYPLAFMMVLAPELVTLAIFIVIPVVAAEVVFLVAIYRHQRLMCAICASMTPLDGAAAVIKHDVDLRRHHNRWFLIPAAAAILIAPGLTALFDLPSVVIPLGTSVAMVFFSLEAKAWQIHRTLEPWCPYCRRYRRWEDDGEPEPSPEPAPSTEAKL